MPTSESSEHEPLKPGDAMYERLNQRIAVAVLFGAAHKDVRPYKIKWNGREYVIQKIGYVHKYQEGRTVYHVFSATDGVNFFELVFNTDDLSWLLGRVGDNESH